MAPLHCTPPHPGLAPALPAEVRIAVALALQRHGGGALILAKYSKGTAKGAAAAAADGGKLGGAQNGAAGAPAAAAAAAAEQAEGLQQYVAQLQETFLQAGGATAAAGEEVGEDGAAGSAQQRQWAIEQLCGVLKQAAAPPEDKHAVLRFLAVHALFSVDAAAAKKVRGLGPGSDTCSAAQRCRSEAPPLRSAAVAQQGARWHLLPPSLLTPSLGSLLCACRARTRS